MKRNAIEAATTSILPSICVSPLWRRGPHSFSVLAVVDLFHPVDVLAVQRFLNGDVRHRCGRRRSMPVLLARRKPDHITRTDLFDRLAFTLNPAEAGDDDQCLAQRMRMPSRACTRLERDTGAAHA